MSVPFEAQRNEPGRRSCGAAALAMVYRSFGLEHVRSQCGVKSVTNAATNGSGELQTNVGSALKCDRETIWAELQRYAPGTDCARTFHLTRHALEQGLAALPCRLDRPWEFLSALPLLPMRVAAVLNHRLRPDSPRGHFSVFLSLDPVAETVRLHDPQFGPNLLRSRSEILDLWTPISSESEITGNVAVLFSAQGTDERICPKCRRTFWREPFESVMEQAFRTVFCPWCDCPVRLT